MRSKTGKIKQALDRAERFKYKTLRRMDKMRATVVEINKIIEGLKEELSDRVRDDSTQAR